MSSPNRRSVHSEAAVGSGALKMAAIAGAGLAVGLVANLARKAAVQMPSALAGSWRDALVAEHKATLRIFDALEATADTHKARRTLLLAQLKHALGKHAFQEENVIYPALREYGSAEQSAALVIDHGDVKHFLFELENLSNGSAAFLPKVRSFRTSLEAHMRREEDEVFPALFQRLSDQQNKKLTLSLNKQGLKLA